MNLDMHFPNTISAGIHPWHILKIDIEKNLQALQQVATKKEVIAIGECGIDRAISIDITRQTDIFLRQNEIAISKDLPIIIHSVKSYSDFLMLLKQGRNLTPWIFHGFSGNFQIAKRLIDKGAFISLGSSLLKNFSKSVETLKKTPLQRIFLETDEADLKIEEIYRIASEIKGIPYEEFVSQIYQNFIYCFNYGRR